MVGLMGCFVEVCVEGEGVFQGLKGKVFNTHYIIIIRLLIIIKAIELLNVCYDPN